MAKRFAVYGLAVLLAVPGLLPAAGASGPVQLPGQATFEENGCAACHGYVGQGANTGPRLAGKMYSEEAFARQLRHPAEEMPPYSPKVIDDARLKSLLAYVNSLK